MSDIFSTQVIIAMVGGLTINLLNLLELQNVPKERRPDFKSFWYWLPFLFYPVLGGIVAYVYSETTSPFGRLVAFHIGLTSPLILRTMANVVPAQLKQQLPPGA